MRGHSHRSTTGPLAKRLERNFQKYVNILTLGSGVENKAPKFVFISKINSNPRSRGVAKEGDPRHIRFSRALNLGSGGKLA